MSGVSKRVKDQRQRALPFEVEESEVRRPITGRRFVEDDPSGLYVGEERLDEFLKSGGMGWVVGLRSELERLDYSELESSYLGGGRPPYHPRTILGLIVYGIMSRSWSLRELEQLAMKDIGAWWVCGGLRPDHSTIGEFIVRHAEVLSSGFMTDLVSHLVKRLKVSASVVAGDGTVVEAAASRYGTLQREAALEAARKAREAAEKDPDDDDLRGAAERAQEVAEVVEKRSAERRKRGCDAQRTGVSPGEPQAVVQRCKDGVVRPSYCSSVLVHEAGMIVGYAVDGSSEVAVVKDLYDQHREVFGCEAPTSLFDGNYLCREVLEESVERGIDVLCAAGSARKSATKKSKKKLHDKRDFHYSEERDAYRCPAGHWLEVCRRGADRGKYRYAMYSTKECTGCSQRSQCTTSRTGRTVKRYAGDELKDAMRTVLAQPAARSQLRRRGQICERPFAEIKYRQGLKRFRRRGLFGARVEFALHCVAYNLKWALAALGGRFAFPGGRYRAVYSALVRLIGLVRRFASLQIPWPIQRLEFSAAPAA